MTAKPALNVPDTSTTNYSRNYSQPRVFEFNLENGESQIAHIHNQQIGFRPLALVLSAFASFTLEVTASKADDIIGGTALWATVSLTSNFTIINAPVTAIRLTSSANGAKARASL